jgi:hypothetical protein
VLRGALCRAAKNLPSAARSFAALRMIEPSGGPNDAFCPGILKGYPVILFRQLGNCLPDGRPPETSPCFELPDGAGLRPDRARLDRA